ncbi:MAG: hypothetical protein IAE93_10975 [Ignavibacteria bacterium]|nr:hypothetical protein [Ignavibacteria bacterium]
MKVFALLEMFSATVFLALALIFYISKDTLGGSVTIPAIFGFIGICSIIAAPLLMKFARKAEEAEKSQKSKI